MMVTLESRTPCPICGYWLSCHAFPYVRVNKRSVRLLRGQYLRTNAGRCPECGFGTCSRSSSPVPGFWLGTPWRLTADSEREVRVYREKHWPDLAKEKAA